LTGITYPVDANYISQFGPAPAYTYTYNALGQLSGMTDNNNNGASVVNGVTYNPAGQLTQMISSSGTETRAYNNMGQLTNITVPAAINLTYTYSTSGQNNGKILSQTDAITGESITYAYDSLNRLICAYGGTSTTPLTGCSTVPSGTTWGQGFQYDGFGNLTAKTVLAGSVPTLSVGIYPNTNHIIGQAYDANGNMLSSPTGSPMSYDVENRLVSTVQYGNPNSMEYAYDGQNKRVWSCLFDTTTSQCSVDQYLVTSQKFYFYGPNGKLLSTFTPHYMHAYLMGDGHTISPPTLTMGGGSNRLYFGSRLLGNEDRLSSRGRYYPYG
jgi:YD repeat-containing protein